MKINKEYYELRDIILYTSSQLTIHYLNVQVLYEEQHNPSGLIINIHHSEKLPQFKIKIEQIEKLVIYSIHIQYYNKKKPVHIETAFTKNDIINRLYKKIFDIYLTEAIKKAKIKIKEANHNL